MLSDYRVLDLSDGQSMLAGRLLSDMGADVIQVEPPGGSPSRRLRPFGGEMPEPDRSPTWLSYARNKRGVVVDLRAPEGRQRLLDLSASSDVLIESAGPDGLANLGLGYDDVRGVNPGIVYVSISPYGLTGPKSKWPATDLTVWAAAGYQYQCGDTDRAPLALTVPQAFNHASMDALLGVLIALHERRASGRGQHIDISAHHSVLFSSLPNNLAVAWNDPGGIYTRIAHGSVVGGRPSRWAYPARDGVVSVLLLFGSAFGPATGRLFDWIHEEGFCDEATRSMDWVGLGQQVMMGAVSPEEMQRIQGVIETFTRSKTKRELFDAAFARRLLIAPWLTVEEVRRDPQLAAREYWTLAALDESSNCRYPGPFARFSETPLQYRRPAPGLGQHDHEVTPRSAGVPAPVPSPNRRAGKPLDGVKVVDFGRVYVLPAAMRMLADFGATVIRVTTSLSIDTMQTLAPMKDGVPAPERAGGFHDANAGKLAMTLNLGTAEGQEVLRKLIAWADVVADGFTPRVMEKYGFDYESVRKINPGAIYLRSSLCGLTGPYAGLAGYGPAAAALSGIHDMCGWPDRLPAGTPGAYTDLATPRFITAAVLAGLEHRDRTGAGQQIDLSHVEACLHFFAPAYVEYEATGHVVAANGNRSPHMAPHGVFPVAGDDRWIALAVEDDSQWPALCSLLGLDELTADPELATLDGRKAQEDRLEQLIRERTCGQDAATMVQRLIDAGIPASVVATPQDLYDDPQLRHRHALVSVKDDRFGTLVVQNARIPLSRTPAVIERSAPVAGEDTELVLREILGYSDAEIAELAAAGALD
jgi:crotonobetainyl-CoA:carnitine CoA-transferase CaiB-like acyl-CoA transferase